MYERLLSSHMVSRLTKEHQELSFTFTVEAALFKIINIANHCSSRMVQWRNLDDHLDFTKDKRINLHP